MPRDKHGKAVRPEGFKPAEKALETPKVAEQPATPAKPAKEPQYSRKRH